MSAFSDTIIAGLGMAGRVEPHPVYIGVAWPYANGGLHLGHVAGSLLPPDIFRRYCRMAGHPVLMVSGSDCHGTPILLKAEAEGRSPGDVVDEYHADHVRALKRLSIGFDLFTRTTTDNHRERVQAIFLDLLETGYIERRTQPAPYDPKAGRFLPDRYVEGTCPHCGDGGARGDQCDACGKTLDPQELKEPRSKVNPGTAIEFRDTEHFFFLLSKLQPQLEAYVERTAAHWRANTINFTQNWLREGLKDRAITRDLTWGVPIPVEGYGDKRLYVWFEAVCGYLTASIEWARRSAADDWEGVLEGACVPSAPAAEDEDAWRWWWTGSAVRSYYFLGKDNIPFHTIVWPAILTAYNEARGKRGEPPLALPWDVPANEFLNLEGRQFSKSRGVSIAVHDVLDRFDADAVRYYLSVNLPEQRDTDWSWGDFRAKVNDELVGIMGNLVHRTLSLAHRHLGPVGAPPSDGDPFHARVLAEVRACNDEVALHVGAVQLKKGIRRILECAGWGNQVMQEAAPWRLVKEDPEAGRRCLYSLLCLVKSLAVHLAPYLPDAAQRTWSMLGEEGSVHDASWSSALEPLREGHEVAEPKALFRKLEPSDVPTVEPPGEAADAGAKARQAKASAPAAPESGKVAGSPRDGLVSIDDFARLELRVARVLRAEEHPKADRLYVLTLDAGGLGERQVVAGLKGHYSPDELEGRTVAFVANLQPARLRGVESQGMVLAAEDSEGRVALLHPGRDLEPGSRIR